MGVASTTCLSGSFNFFLNLEKNPPEVFFCSLIFDLTTGSALDLGVAAVGVATGCVGLATVGVVTMGVATGIFFCVDITIVIKLILLD